ncbi:methyl-accepting chemotaxis protein [Amantichitinum ursilacus]|uniref:Frizzy aggregation protein FrzCD n=1 Tax=Amantichitinum ursilacus TaxID=857265 RepID=A0A0N0GQT8_9NEIS|nr:CHASE3 domain-containing protein [Amantichitinum ursilacus]KPC55190.1 Frizzy aggregation protein FrzCD [Amantichitinum ursilacus]
MKSSIGVKLWSSLLVVLAAIIIVGVAAWTNINKFTESEKAIAHALDVQSQLADVLSLLKDAETGQRGYVITGEDRYLEPYNNAVAQIDNRLATLAQTVEKPETKQAIAQLTVLADAKLAELKETIGLRRDKGFDAARAVVLSDRGKTTMDQARGIVTELNKKVVAALEARNAEAEANSAFTVDTIVIGISLTALFVLGAGIFLNRAIVGPLRDLTRVAERISVGDLSVDAQVVKRDDEVGALNAAFIRMTESLRGMAHVAQRIAEGDLRGSITPVSSEDVLGTAFATMTQNLRQVNREIAEGVSVLTASASEIQVSASQIAAAAAETATATTETATTVEEVKQTALVSSQKARYVADVAQRSAQVSVAGRKSVDESMLGMQQVREQMEQIGDSILRLSEQSQAIGEIIATVNDLAEQSNLLAVNASIEAAKAGEQGRGFAVVAQEVKSLAEQSRQATAQVRTILGDIQKATSRAVVATEQGNRAVEAGTRLSREAGESIRLLAESSDESAEAASQIAVSAQQQLAGMGQLAQAADNIKVAATQNMEGTRQTEVAAHNLHMLGQKLKQVVDRYQV